jgi:hypothetical protein
VSASRRRQLVRVRACEGGVEDFGLGLLDGKVRETDGRDRVVFGSLCSVLRSFDVALRLFGVDLRPDLGDVIVPVLSDLTPAPRCFVARLGLLGLNSCVVLSADARASETWYSSFSFVVLAEASTRSLASLARTASLSISSSDSAMTLLPVRVD